MRTWVIVEGTAMILQLFLFLFPLFQSALLCCNVSDLLLPIDITMFGSIVLI
jgi:hypothetical protein